MPKSGSSPGNTSMRRTPGLVLGRYCAEQAHPAVGFRNHHVPPTTRRGQPIVLASDSHAMCIAPTGAGKTSGPAICNMLVHPGSAICLDPKGAIKAVTERRRKTMGHRIVTLDLREGRPTDSLNPMDLARLCSRDPSVAGRVVATSLVARGTDERDPYWSDISETLLATLSAEVIDNGRLGPATIATLHDLLGHEEGAFAMALAMDNGAIARPASRAAVGGILSLPEATTRPCVLSSVQQHLRLWDLDLVRTVTGSTSFDLQALINGGPVTIYIVVPPTRLLALAPLLRLWVSGLLTALSLREVRPQHATLLMIDEAASLGRMEALVTAATLLRSWGVQLFTMWQTLSQLDIYREHARTLVDNAGVIQILGVRNARMAREFVDLVGGVPPERLLGLRPGQQVLALDGGRPFVAEQMRYYDDPMFRSMFDHDPGMSNGL